MFFLYVDESGDAGKFTGTNSRHYILSGLIISDENWNDSFKKMQRFRKFLNTEYNFGLRTEIHAAELIRIHKLKEYRNFKKKTRLLIFQEFLTQMPSIFPLSKVINICLTKTDLEENYSEFQSLAWSRMIQRFDTLLKKNGNQRGIIITDDTDEPLIRSLMRKTRVYNPTQSRFGGVYNPVTDNILEDPFLRDSKHSFFIQDVDSIAHSLFRKEFPKSSLRKWNVQKYFESIEPLLLKEATNYDSFGIVRK